MSAHSPPDHPSGALLDPSAPSLPAPTGGQNDGRGLVRRHPSVAWAVTLGLLAPLLLLGLMATATDPGDRRVAPAFLALVVALAILAGSWAALAAAVTSAAALWVAVFTPTGAFEAGSGKAADLALFALSVGLVVVLVLRLDRAVREARSTSRVLRDFLAAAPLGIGVFDRDLRFEQVNEKLAAMTRIPVDEHLRRRFTELTSRPEAGALEREMRRVLDSGEALLGHRVEVPDGTFPDRNRTLRVSLVPLGGPPRPTELAVIIEDVTAEDDARARNAVVTECGEQLALAADADDAVQRVTDVLVHHVAARARIDLAMDHDPSAVVEPPPAAVGSVTTGEATSGRAARRARCEVRRDRSGTTTETVSVAPVALGRTGRVFGTLELTWPGEVTLHDADLELHQTVATLTAGALTRIEAIDRLGRDVFRAALDAMLDDVAIARAVRDDDGRIVDFVLEHANANSRDGAGRGPDEMIGRRTTELYPSWAESGMLEAFIGVVESGEPLIADELSYEDVAADGTPISGWWRLLVVPFGDGYLATWRDITDQVELRERARLDAERARRERIAVDLLQQAALPPSLPGPPGLEVAATYLPATTDAPVGGDWYDAFEVGDGTVALVVGDVAGHGRQSAVEMLQARSLLRAVAANGGDPGRVFSEVNRMLAALWQSRTFATCVLCLLDPSTGAVTTARAGHPPPVVGSAGGSFAVELPGGPPFGIDDRFTYPSSAFTLAPEGHLVLFSDGLVEDRHRPIDTGIAELTASVAEVVSVGADAMCTHVVDRVADEARVDDVCVLVARRRPLAGPS
jgi:PAS domain-containing protein